MKDGSHWKQTGYNIACVLPGPVSDPEEDAVFVSIIAYNYRCQHRAAFRLLPFKLLST